METELQTVKKNRQNAVEPHFIGREQTERGHSAVLVVLVRKRIGNIIAPELFNFTKILRMTVEFVFVILQMSFRLHKTSLKIHEKNTTQNNFGHQRLKHFQVFRRNEDIFKKSQEIQWDIFAVKLPNGIFGHKCPEKRKITLHQRNFWSVLEICIRLSETR